MSSNSALMSEIGKITTVTKESMAFFVGLEAIDFEFVDAAARFII